MDIDDVVDELGKLSDKLTEILKRIEKIERLQQKILEEVE